MQIAFANFPIKFDRHNLARPKQPGEVSVVLAFKSASRESSFEEQRSVYKEMALENGKYKPGTVSDRALFRVTVYAAGSSALLTQKGATGSATLSVFGGGRVCGSFAVESRSGSTAEGSFSLEVERDLWAE